MKRSLNGQWHLDLHGTPHIVSVPGCWEAIGVPKDAPGPFSFQRPLDIPHTASGKRWWLRFEGVSYHATVYLDEKLVGEHTGSWDAFELEVTGFLQPGESATLRVDIEKPASLRQGPASESVAGRFSLKETLSGFLPYVWGHLFGGIWQNVWLEARPAVNVEAAFIRANANGSFVAEVELSSSALPDTPCALEILSPEGDIVTKVTGKGQMMRLAGSLEHARPWHPETPVLYEARLVLSGEVIHSWHFGFRSFEALGTTLYLNDAPVYPRMALSWGWYPDILHSNPGRAQVREDLLRLKALGYNGIKLCLWVPPAYYFELADELGMLLWLELPMWLPKATPFFKEQTPREYARIVRQVRQHPSLIIYSLGCELNREVGAEILEPLYHQTKALIGEALLRDNSGSGEAYGGLLNEFADYYDYHFYSDIQFFGELIDTFTPRWRPVQPWVFGEFCDLDTFRELGKLTNAGEKPWWTSADPAPNPQGARWQFDVPFQDERLAASGYAERQGELETISHKQALLHRKFTLELVRTYQEISGYVVTGERDTPISTAGMWDDMCTDKFPAGAFEAFNDDLLLTLGWDKRRAWVAGGDRAAHWDTFSYPEGARVRAHLIASNYSQASGGGTLTWRVLGKKGLEHATGVAEVTSEVGSVRELAIAEFDMPENLPPQRLTLEAELTLGNVKTSNSWPLWCFPENPWRGVGPFTLIDPDDQLEGLADVAESTEASPTELDRSSVLLTTVWNEAAEQFVESGGRAILLIQQRKGTGPFKVQPVPFWREAVKVLEAHLAWGDFPHEGWTDLQFFGMASDLALEPGTLPGSCPILQRLDVRTMDVHSYAAELSLGQGTLIVSTLRFQGGLGRQPIGIKRNVAASYLLSCWLRYLQSA